MTPLVWIMLLAMIAYNSFLLWRAYVKRVVKSGITYFYPDKTPISFWFYVAVLSASDLFLIVCVFLLLRYQGN